MRIGAEQDKVFGSCARQSVRHRAGTGKNFVQLHDGTVTAFSEGIGYGSEFTVALPILENTDETVSHVKNKPALISGKRFSRMRIMIVDDNQDALKTLANLLKEYDFDIVTADNPIEALVVAGQFRPELALLDIGLPLIDGYQLAKKLRRQILPQE